MIVLLCSCPKAFMIDDIFVPSFLFAPSDFSQQACIKRAIQDSREREKKKKETHSTPFSPFFSMIDNISLNRFEIFTLILK